ncbi:MAG TPA: TonB family protein [Candidatus Binataceae bacterium]|nr:TonB family protein [Candidatus Binataceae bacterium]
MKICPRCGKTFPDSERFCETDGTALVTSGGAGRQTAATPEAAAGLGGGICPECGGRTEPGETICNFCGTRLGPETSAAPASAGTAYTGGPGGQGQTANPEDYVPAHDRVTAFGQDPNFGAPPDYDQAQYDEPPRRGIIGALGYIAAAVIALAAGAGLAVYLSTRHEAPPPVAQASASPSPSVAEVPSGPLAELARNMQIQVKGPDLAAALQRDPGSARTVFENNKAGLLNTYKAALATDSSLHDGMVVRLSVNPDGTVASGGVITSTATNPSLDAEVVSTMSGWKFPPVSGGGPVNVDYPVIFAATSTDMASIESDLNTKLASVGPNEVPEYTSAPMPAATPAAVAALPPPAPALPPPPPVPAAAPPPVASRHTRGHTRHRATEARPKPSLTEEVMAALRANRRTRRVQAYAGYGGTVTLTGSVFDERDKAFAERTVRNVSGVTSVIDNVTVQTAQWTVNQDRIQRELQNAGLTGVTVRVIGSDAYLDGQVKTNLDKERAVTITMSAAPVQVRGNLIRVVPGNIFGF